MRAAMCRRRDAYGGCSIRESAGLGAPLNSRFNSMSAASSTRGRPVAMAAQTIGSSIHPAIETTKPVGPRTFKNWPVARCSTRRTLTLQRK